MPIIGSGTFVLSPSLSSGLRDTGTEITLSPGPTFVDYGERLAFTFQESAGRDIKQFSTQNPRRKRWVWTGYGPDVPKYEDQYWVLFNHQEHIRTELLTSGSPYVYLKDSVTRDLGTFTSGTVQITPDWVRCRILLVTRNIDEAGGQVRYPETELIFTVDDPHIRVY